MRWVWLLIIILAGAVAGGLFTRFEADPPEIGLAQETFFVGSEPHRQEIRVSDQGMGVERLRVWIQAGDREHVLIDERFDGSLLFGAKLRTPRSLDAVIDRKALGLAEGPATLHVEALDYSWRGNSSQRELAFTVDSKPPRLSLETGLTYVRRGGAELAIYRTSNDAREHGVRLGDLEFRGYPHPADPERFVVLYALPPDAPSDAAPELYARDRAGNATSVPLTVSVIEREFAHDDITLSEDFMRRKVAELLPEHAGDALAGYLEINRGMRERNDRKIREVSSRSSEDRLWSGSFQQLPGSRVFAAFAERRTYRYAGREVDEQVHLGFDLASTARSPVLAANDGVVAYAGHLGIYGNTVILDHGQGLASLYGHLSEVAVEQGTVVAKGESLGRTGSTGLAGGDHLHFSMLVGGVFVDPLEWFDEKWIREHILVKLEPPAPEEPTPASAPASAGAS